MPAGPIRQPLTAPSKPRAISRDSDASDIVYSFGTLVTSTEEYQQMVEAFTAAGFTSEDCEYLYADNTRKNEYDAFTAYNQILREAKGRYVILCHQDILPLNSHRVALDVKLRQLTELDEHWGVCGNAGGKTDGDLAVFLTHGPNRDRIDHGGPFPQRVMSLDENFMIARRDANLALSRDLSGFHWYGADLCVIADVLGWNAYVIDFSLYHKSTGNVGEQFRTQAHAFRNKYRNAFRSRWHIVPTRMSEYLSGSKTRIFLARVSRRIRGRT